MVAITADPAPARFSMGRVVTRTFEVFGQNLIPFLILATLSVAPPMIVSFLIARSLPPTVSPLAIFTPLRIVVMIFNVIFALVMGYLLQAALVQGTITSLNGRPASLGECLSTAVRFLPRLIGIGILAGLGMIFASLLLIVPGLILFTMWSVVAPACVAENLNIGGSFSRSTDLTRGHRWAIFGLVFAFGLACLVATFALRPLAGAGILPTSHDHMPQAVLYWIVDTALRIITTSIGGIGIASVYYELRTIKEGVGPEQLAAVFA
jgi:hypothetical protein